MSEMIRQAAPLLQIEDGSFAYKGGPQILKDINIEVEPGEILAVLGPNGSGKTTMLRCMMDMLHWQSGRSLLGGEGCRLLLGLALGLCRRLLRLHGGHLRTLRRLLCDPSRLLCRANHLVEGSRLRYVNWLSTAWAKAARRSLRWCKVPAACRTHEASRCIAH